MNKFHYGAKMEGKTDRLDELAKSTWRKHVKEWAGVELPAEAVLVKYPANRTTERSYLVYETDYVYSINGEWFTISLHKTKNALGTGMQKAYSIEPYEIGSTSLLRPEDIRELMQKAGYN